MTKLVATVAYDGTHFSGWQIQAEQRTVQGELQRAFESIVQHPVRVRGAGRTDAGVHAQGQKIALDWDHPLPPERVVLAMAALLPHDITLRDVQPCASNCDVKSDSLGKRYVYRIHLASHRPLRERAWVWHRRGHLDVAAMQRAAQDLVGEHDFESFRQAGCQAAHARRCVWAVNVQRDDEIISIEVRGNAFVRGMVRVISGTLYEVGRGRQAPDSMPSLLAARNRALAGITAPAKGLTLEEVYMPQDETRAGIPDWAKWPGFRMPVAPQSKKTDPSNT